MIWLLIYIYYSQREEQVQDAEQLRIQMTKKKLLLGSTCSTYGTNMCARRLGEVVDESIPGFL